jgi:hypothetical protein
LEQARQDVLSPEGCRNNITFYYYKPVELHHLRLMRHILQPESLEIPSLITFSSQFLKLMDK